MHGDFYEMPANHWDKFNWFVERVIKAYKVKTSIYQTQGYHSKSTVIGLHACVASVLIYVIFLIVQIPHSIWLFFNGNRISRRFSGQRDCACFLMLYLIWKNKAYKVKTFIYQTQGYHSKSTVIDCGSSSRVTWHR
jgi:hypothetical protein